MKIPRVNKAQRMTNAAFESAGVEPRVNAADRRLINQGKMSDPRAPQVSAPRPAVSDPVQQAMQEATAALTASPGYRGPQPGQSSPTNMWSNMPTQKLPDVLPDGSQRRPGDPNSYMMGPNGQMMGTLIGWPGMNESLPPSTKLPPFKFSNHWGIPGLSTEDRMTAAYGKKPNMSSMFLGPQSPLSRTSTISPGIGLDGKPINYGR